MPDDGEDICGEANKTGGACKNPAVNDDGSCWIPSHGPAETEREDPGRPSKLDMETQETIAGFLEEGYSAKVAARKAGISRGTYQRWRKRGKAAREANEQGPFRDFYDRTEAARAEGEKRWTERAYKYAIEAESFGAAMEILRKRYPDSWTSEAHEDDGDTRLQVMLTDGREGDERKSEYTMTPSDGSDSPDNE